MEEGRNALRLTRKVLVVLALGITLSGCATHETADMLNSRMGRMNYEEALQRFGPPTQCAEAGRTKTCTWVYSPSGTVYAPMGNSVVAIPTHATTARLTFTNESLSNWYLTGNWR